MKYLYIPISLLVISFELWASDLQSEEAKRAALQLQNVINKQVTRIVALENKAGVKTEQFRLQQKAQSTTGLFGAVVDLTRRVLAVTPGGQAEKLGLKSGDYIVKLNGDSIADGWERSVQHQPQDTEVKLLVERNGRELVLQGVMLVESVPEWNMLVGTESIPELPLEPHSVKGCGTIITSDNHLAKSGYLKVEAIDGVPVVEGEKVRRTRFTLESGEHILTLRNRHYTVGAPASKRKFRVKVEKDKAYYMTWVNNIQLDQGSGVSAYSGPVIAKIKPQPCG